METVNPLRKAFSLNSISRYHSFAEDPFIVDEYGGIKVTDEFKFRNLPLFRDEAIQSKPLVDLIRYMEADLNSKKHAQAFQSSAENLKNPSAPSRVNGLPTHWLSQAPSRLRYAGHGTDTFLRRQILQNRYSQKVGHVPTIPYTFHSIHEPLLDPRPEYLQQLKETLNILKYRQCTTVVIPLSIRSEQHHIGHAEILLLEHFLSDAVVVTRFDPNGSSASYWSEGSAPIYDAFLAKCFDAGLGPSAWRWNTDDNMAPSCPRVSRYRGPQARADRIEGELGFCQTWILLYVHLRLRNEHLTSKAFDDFLRNQTPSQLMNLIQNFAEHATDPEFEKLDPVAQNRQIWKEEMLLTLSRLDDLTLTDREFILALNERKEIIDAFNLVDNLPLRRALQMSPNEVLPFSIIFRLSQVDYRTKFRGLTRFNVTMVVSALKKGTPVMDVVKKIKHLEDFVQMGSEQFKYFLSSASHLLPSTISRIADGALSESHLQQLALFATLKNVILASEQRGVFSTTMVIRLETLMMEDEDTLNFQDARLQRIVDRFRIAT